MVLQAAMFTDGEGLSLGLVMGVIVVAALILAAVLGARRKEREPEPDRMPHSPERDAWSTPLSTPGHAPHGDASTPEHIIYTRP
ncbi:DUF6479 family protein [Streptacidiphilus sp. PAMC 29251]